MQHYQSLSATGPGHTPRRTGSVFEQQPAPAPPPSAAPRRANAALRTLAAVQEVDVQPPDVGRCFIIWLLAMVIVATLGMIIVIPVVLNDPGHAYDNPGDLNISFAYNPPDKHTIRLQNADSNQPWLTAVASLFNKAYESYNSSGVAVNVFHTNSAFNYTYRPVIYAPAKPEWVHVLRVGIAECREEIIIPTGWAMWRSRALELGWPNSSPVDQTVVAQLIEHGWKTLSPRLASWGTLKLGHGLPSTTTSGINTVLSVVAHATQPSINATGIKHSMAAEDVNSTVALKALQAYERSVEHVSPKDTMLLDQMMAERARQPDVSAPAYLDAVSVLEPTVLQYNEMYAEQMAAWNDSLVFVFLDHTVWDSHPYCLVDANWVTAEDRVVARLFLKFLSGPEARQLTKTMGYRTIPDNFPRLNYSTASPMAVNNSSSEEHIDPARSATHDVELNRSYWTVPWADAKRRVMLCLALDVSSMMQFNGRLDDVKHAAQAFLQSLRNDTRFQVVTFAKSPTVLEAGTVATAGYAAEEAISALTASYDQGSMLYAATEQCLDWINREQVGSAVQDSHGDRAMTRVVVSVSSGLGTDYLDRRQRVYAWIDANRQQGMVTTIHGIFFASPQGGGFDQQYYEELVTRTGGSIFKDVQQKELPLAFTTISSMF